MCKEHDIHTFNQGSLPNFYEKTIHFPIFPLLLVFRSCYILFKPFLTSFSSHFCPPKFFPPFPDPLYLYVKIMLFFPLLLVFRSFYPLFDQASLSSPPLLNSVHTKHSSSFSISLKNFYVFPISPIHSFIQASLPSPPLLTSIHTALPPLLILLFIAAVRPLVFLSNIRL